MRTQLLTLLLCAAASLCAGTSSAWPLFPHDTVREQAGATEPATNAVPVPSVFRSAPRFSLKTNLLFDLVSALNVEAEMALGRHWSVAGEWMFPWWLGKGSQRCFQVSAGTLEVRRWFPDRNLRQPMDGWFAGIYAGAGVYDIAWKTEGYQGEFLLSLGVAAGYAHRLAGNLSMAYSLGAGYLQTRYRRYEPRADGDGAWHLIRRNDGRYTWLGPTRARVSLAWMFNSPQGKTEAR